MTSPTIKRKVDQLGEVLIEIFHVSGLFVIGATIVWSAESKYETESECSK